jgi:HAD superfamily hydrolase (TIGR01509 family)
VDQNETVTEQLVWDMDGTLLNSTTAVPDAFIDTVRELGGPSYSRSEVVDAYSLGVPEVILAHLVRRRVTDEEAERYYGRLSNANVAPYDGITAVLAELRFSGHLLVVFTGASTRAATLLLGAAAIDVDLLVGGDQVERPKPAPDGLIAVAQQLGLATASLAYIGDAPMDLQAAKSAGAHSVAAAWGHLYDSSQPADTTLARPEDALALVVGRKSATEDPGCG